MVFANCTAIGGLNQFWDAESRYEIHFSHIGFSINHAAPEHFARICKTKNVYDFLPPLFYSPNPNHNSQLYPQELFLNN